MSKSLLKEVARLTPKPKGYLFIIKDDMLLVEKESRQLFTVDGDGYMRMN